MFVEHLLINLMDEFEFEIVIGSTTAARVIEGEVTVETILNEYFGEDSSRRSAMTNWLRYTYEGGGSPSVHDFEIENVQSTSNKIGTFRVKFTVNVYFGCDDMDTFHQSDVNFGYTVDAKSRMIRCKVVPALWNNSFDME